MTNIEEFSTEFIPIVDVKKNKNRKSIIKVIGVGGGGCNAVRHMYNMGINDVDFIVCNTDEQALESSPIPVKIHLGEDGLGAGANPTVAQQAAIASEADIKAAIQDANMVFITAGMGGGTGTGASPIIASIAREMGILTVGIVTFPFDFEQEEKFVTAQKGIEELHENTDALLVIKNQSLSTYYPDLKLSNAFAKADDVLLVAAKSIAELITLEAIINIDFHDVDTILRGSGTAIIGSGTAKGENRAYEAVYQAIESPLLDNNSIYGAEKMLMFISYSREFEATVAELTTITNELQAKTCNMKKKFIWGHGVDDSLGEELRVTIIATELHNQSSNKQKINNLSPAGPQTDSTPKVDNTKITTINTNENDGKKVIPLYGDSNISNEALRNMNDQEMDSYINMPSYLRNKLNVDKRQEEISNYKVSNSGIECQPPILRDVVD